MNRLVFFLSWFLYFWFTLSLLLFFPLSVAFGLLLNQNCFDVVVTLWKKVNYFFSVRKCFKFFILFSFFRYHGFKIFKKSFEESVREILCNLVKKSLRILHLQLFPGNPILCIILQSYVWYEICYNIALYCLNSDDIHFSYPCAKGLIFLMHYSN